MMCHLYLIESSLIDPGAAQFSRVGRLGVEHTLLDIVTALFKPGQRRRMLSRFHRLVGRFSSLLMVLAAISVGTTADPVSAFLQQPTCHAAAASIHRLVEGRRYCPRPRLRAETSSSSSLRAAAGTTLTEETTWNMRLVLRNLPTTRGGTVDRIFAVRAKFVEEPGYEPPQGYLVQVMEGGDETTTTGDGRGRKDEDNRSKEDRKETAAVTAGTTAPQMRIVSSRWQLSEDPNDRRDSLWVWGLFKEPLYPFLLLQMEMDEIPLPPPTTMSGGGEEEGRDSIKPFKLFAQIDHRRENGQVILSSGADLTMKEKETIRADPFGAATVDVFEDVSVGRLQIQAMTTKV
jgi:hypothetical protein